MKRKGKNAKDSGALVKSASGNVGDAAAENDVPAEEATLQTTLNVVCELEKGKWELQIDPQLEELLTPLEPDEYSRLKTSIERDGCMDPLFTWNNVIVDGHNRYKICWECDIPFSVKELDFADKDDAILWMIERQLGRRNLPAYVKGELILRSRRVFEEKAKKNQGKRNDLTGNFYANSHRSQSTLKAMAGAAGIGENTMYRIRKLTEEADEGTKEELRKGRMSVNKAFTELKKKQKPTPSPVKPGTDDVITETIPAGRSEDAKSVLDSDGTVGSCMIAETDSSTDNNDSIVEFGNADEESCAGTDICAEICIPSEAEITSETSILSETDDYMEPTGRREDSTPICDPEYTFDRITKYSDIPILDHPIEVPTDRQNPYQEPRDFLYVQGQVHFAFKNMLKELKIGLDWISNEDRKRIPELREMFRNTAAQVEQMMKNIEEDQNG